MARKQTASLEDYLEAVLEISDREGVARISTISDQLGVTKPSVSYAIGRLTEKGFVRHEDYGYVELTPEGRTLAEKVIEKHELLKVFIEEILGVGREDAEKEACCMEHCLDDGTKDKLEGLVEFILSGPRSAEWLENLRYFQENRRRSPGCRQRCAGRDDG